MSVQTAHDYRYTDRDVREDDRLRELAIAYLQQYGGDFDPLVRAKRAMLAGAELTTTIIRTVLNCMRHDVNVADKMPIPTTPFYIMPSPPRRKGHVVKDEPVYRHPFELKTKWKKQYIAATTKMASAYHLLDPVDSIIRYYPMTGKFQALPRAYCNAALVTGILLDEPPEGRHLCNSCVKRKEALDLKAAERAAEAARLRGDDATC